MSKSHIFSVMIRMGFEPVQVSHLVLPLWYVVLKKGYRLRSSPILDTGLLPGYETFARNPKTGLNPTVR